MNFAFAVMKVLQLLDKQNMRSSQRSMVETKTCWCWRRRYPRVLLLMGLESHGAHGMVLEAQNNAHLNRRAKNMRAATICGWDFLGSSSSWLQFGLSSSGAATSGFKTSGRTMTICVFRWRNLMPTLEGSEQMLTVFKVLQLGAWKFGCSKNYGFSTALAGCSSNEQGCHWRRRHR